MRREFFIMKKFFFFRMKKLFHENEVFKQMRLFHIDEIFLKESFHETNFS